MRIVMTIQDPAQPWPLTPAWWCDPQEIQVSLSHSNHWMVPASKLTVFSSVASPYLGRTRGMLLGRTDAWRLWEVRRVGGRQFNGGKTRLSVRCIISAPPLLAVHSPLCGDRGGRFYLGQADNPEKPHSRDPQVQADGLTAHSLLHTHFLIFLFFSVWECLSWIVVWLIYQLLLFLMG